MRTRLVLLLFVALAGPAALVAWAQDSGQTITRIEFQDPFAPRAERAPVVPVPPDAPIAVIQGQSGKKGQDVRRQSVTYYSVATAEDAGIGREAEGLARAYAAEKSETERDKLKSRLSEILQQQFDKRQKRHEDEIKELEAQVKKLRDLVEKRQENRREIIARRLDQILRDAQGLGW